MHVADGYIDSWSETSIIVFFFFQCTCRSRTCTWSNLNYSYNDVVYLTNNCGDYSNYLDQA